MAGSLIIQGQPQVREVAWGADGSVGCFYVEFGGSGSVAANSGRDSGKVASKEGS